MRAKTEERLLAEKLRREVDVVGTLPDDLSVDDLALAILYLGEGSKDWWAGAVDKHGSQHFALLYYGRSSPCIMLTKDDPKRKRPSFSRRPLVGGIGLEPTASCTSSTRSDQLS